MDILELAREHHAWAVEARRYLHTHPEAAPQEQLETMAWIEARLDEMDVEHLRIPGGGILGFIGRDKPGKTLLMRADIDALPIEEESCNLRRPRTCVSCKPGLMHACGHDAHTAMLLAQARILKSMEEDLSGRVLLLFEEGEEGGGNIKKICRYIGRENLKIDGCYAAHVRWDIPTGKIALCEGSAMCGQMRFLLKIRGKSGHGSRPDLGRNVVDCFHLIYTAWQTLRMTRVRPDSSLTWSVCSVHAGMNHNILPDSLTCEGTIRMMDMDSGDAFWHAFHRAALCCGEQCGCQVELERVMYLLPLSGEASSQQLYKSEAEKVLGQGSIIACKPWMASESFSYLSCMYPSVFAFVGIMNEEYGSGANHHTPQFDLDEDGMLYGVAAAVAYCLAFLNMPAETSAFVPAAANLNDLMDLVEKQSSIDM